ncbi:hypothetical protein IPZ58_13190 [Streptomyces roseoverticillatus]|uniref:hypothetical protein n=1 Tax=Streptomyces roseoverticillatus TaxID=66429 RepID=UPI001F368374|nr:hypothetical protein [Streptomyces roseoverticillatus]MCF3102534.1 hypothetical protein [Streptomyces roseoverticillatus]
MNDAQPQKLSPEEEARIREGIAGAVLGAPEGLAESLEHDPQGYLRLVVATRTGAEETSRLLRQAVQGARAAGHSWDTIGRLLGVSRQAAQQRFAAKDTAAPKGSPERRVLTPLTAFNEMPALAEAGLEGWELVDYGPLYHAVVASDRRWEYRRVTLAVAGRARRMKADGWTEVGNGYFPWSYYKRPLKDD